MTSPTTSRCAVARHQCGGTSPASSLPGSSAAASAAMQRRCACAWNPQNLLMGAIMNGVVARSSWRSELKPTGRRAISCLTVVLLLVLVSACSSYGTTGSGGTTGAGGTPGAVTGGGTGAAGGGSSAGAGTPYVAPPSSGTPSVPATSPASSAGTGAAAATVAAFGQTGSGSTGLPASPGTSASPSPLVVPAVSGSATPVGR
jgi:hypothetical protein